jgi:hypothetical protein
MKPVKIYQLLLYTLIFLLSSSVSEACRWPHLFCHRDRCGTLSFQCVDPGVSQPEYFYVVYRINDAGAQLYEGHFETWSEAVERYYSLQWKRQSAVIWQVPK